MNKNGVSPSETISKGIKGLAGLGHANLKEHDILHIDAQIKHSLLEVRVNVKEMYDRLKTLLWIMTDSNDSSEKIKAEKTSKILRHSIRNIERGTAYISYIIKTEGFINEYKTLIKKTGPQSFMGKKTEDETTLKQKALVVKKYLAVARNYIPELSKFEKPSKQKCHSCDGDDFITDPSDESFVVCSKCFTKVEILNDAPSFKDTDRVNMTTKYRYSCRGHYIEAIDHYEGKRVMDGMEKVLDRIKGKMVKHNIELKNLTKDNVYMFLTELKEGDYYDMINLLYFKLTGEKCPDISNYRDELLRMHDYIDEAFGVCKNEDRVKSLNVNYKLFKSLQILGYGCKREHFYFLKTHTKLVEHDVTWTSIIKYLSTKYPEMKTSTGKKMWVLYPTV